MEQNLKCKDCTLMGTDRSITKVDKEADGTLTLSVCIEGAETQRSGYDTLIYAIGRSPAVSGLGLEEIGVKQNTKGHIIVDEYQETGVPGVYALGDVCGIQELTPVSAVRSSFFRCLSGTVIPALSSYRFVGRNCRGATTV